MGDVALAAAMSVLLWGPAILIYEFSPAVKQANIKRAVELLAEPQCLRDTAEVGSETVTLVRCWHAQEVQPEEWP